jgi:DNA gyrase/topoisomerase IV subunit A
MQIVVSELRAVQAKFGEPRKTEILADEGDFRIEDLAELWEIEEPGERAVPKVDLSMNQP